MALEPELKSQFEERVLRDVEEVRLTEFAVYIKLSSGLLVIARPSYFDEIVECRDEVGSWFYDCVENNLRMEYSME